MAKILLINPIEKVGKSLGGKKVSQKRATRKRRTPAQIAATKRLVALNKGRRRKVAVKRRRNPVGASKQSIYSGVATLRPNPVRRRRRATGRSVSASTGRKMSYRRRRRSNPIGVVDSLFDILQGSVVGSLWGAGGAVTVDAVAAALPLPEVMKTGYGKHLTKGVMSGLLGVGAAYVLDPRTAEQVAAGGLTVSIYGALSDLVRDQFPGISLGFYNASLPATRRAVSQVGAYVSGGTTTKGAAPALPSSAGMGAYVSGGRSNVTRIGAQGNYGRSGR